MKKYIVIVLGILVVIIGVLGIIAPKEFLIEKTVVIAKPRFYVFDHLRSLKNHEAWNPWIKKDKAIRYDYKGVDGTVGFITHWVGNSEVGEGEQEIKKIVEGERIDYELRFKEPFEGTNYSYVITTEAPEDKTNFTWGMKGKLSFPSNIFYMMFKAEEKLQYDFTEGTNVLKAILEKEVN